MKISLSVETTTNVLTIELNGFVANLYKTKDFGWTVNLISGNQLISGTQQDLQNYVMFLEYVNFYLQELNAQ